MMKYASVITILLVLAAAAPASAQDSTLDRVQNLVATGRFTEARSTLDQWEQRFADPRSNASAADRARAMYLRGTLSSDAKEAEDAFVGVVLSYPSSAVAPDALLRLGQGLLTAGEPRRAVAYLERLQSDYPGTPQRETGWVWLARAHLAAGAPAAACNTARAGLEAVTSANLRTLIELERDQACARVTDAATAPGIAAAPARSNDRPVLPDERPVLPDERSVLPGEPAADPEPAPADRNEDVMPRTQAPLGTREPAPRPVAQQDDAPAVPPAARGAGDFSVQTATFRERSSAEVVAAQLRERGFDARVTSISGSALHRVRVGYFTSSADAQAVATRIRNAGFATIVVNDVRFEH
ncbi:MAG TPA: SPOR domain-containing protein [Longimicrobiales bacterium]|nr:SPOR domain-containing protein [Longimicrobiales bacterium]